MELTQNAASDVAQVADQVETRRRADLTAARQRGHYARLDTEDEIWGEVIEALREKQRTQWKPGSEKHKGAEMLASRYQEMIEQNQFLRENKQQFPDLSPAETARQDQIRAAVAGDKLGVVKLACLLCYAMEALLQTDANHKEMWLGAAESLKDDIARAEKQGGTVSEDLAEAIQLPIDDSFFRFYAGTMFNSAEDIGDAIRDPCEGASAAIQQAAVCSLIIGTPAEATEEICQLFRISEEEAARLLGAEQARS